jgi:hypothetical protein
MRIYRKKCEELGVTPSKLLRTKIEEALEGDTPHLKKVTSSNNLVDVLVGSRNDRNSSHFLNIL